MNITRWLSFSIIDNGSWRGDDTRWSAKDVRVTTERPTDRLAVKFTITIPIELIAPAVEAMTPYLETPTTMAVV